MFHIFGFPILSNQKRQRSNLLHVVEQRILYKTVPVAISRNSIFSKYMSAPNDLKENCHINEKVTYGIYQEVTIYHTRNVAKSNSYQMIRIYLDN